MAIQDPRPSQHPVWWTYPSYNPWIMPPPPAQPAPADRFRCATNVVDQLAA